MPAGLTIRLTEEEKQELRQVKLQRKVNIGERANYVLLLGSGKTVREIAKLHGNNRHTVRLWIKRYQAEGIEGLRERKPPGRPNKKEKWVAEHLGEILEQSPQAYGYQQRGWQLNLLADYSRGQGEELSEMTIQRAIRKQGWVYKRFAKQVPRNAPSAQAKKAAVKALVEELKAEKETEAVEVVFGDEAHMTNEPYVERGWFRRGEKKELSSQRREVRRRCLEH